MRNKNKNMECATCGKSIIRTKKGTYVSDCICETFIVPDRVVDTGRNIILNLTDTTAVEEKFGS
tara:strand:+ start:7240 stop:7431 length:192 start_codon:yes stop_codon:yes gene_type:complete